MCVSVVFACQHHANGPLLTQSIVKVMLPMKVTSLVKVKLLARRSDWKTDNLPIGATEGNKWRKIFVPTFGAYIGTKHAPWEVSDKGSLEALQSCWNHVYQSTTAAEHKISNRIDIVFVLIDVLGLVKY